MVIDVIDHLLKMNNLLHIKQIPRRQVGVDAGGGDIFEFLLFNLLFKLNYYYFMIII